MGLFTRKVGGTFFGNLLRGVAHGINPALGNGGLMISQQDYDKKNMSDDDYQKTYGVKKDGKPSIIPQLSQQVGAVFGSGVTGLEALGNGAIQYKDGNIVNNMYDGADKGIQGILKKYGGYIVGGVALLVLIIVMIFKKK